MLSRTVKRLFAYNSGYKQPTSTGKYQKCKSIGMQTGPKRTAFR